MDNWDDLRHFLAVFRQGSLNAAARELGVDQSTVYRRLKSLEQFLGTRVFDHRHHGKYELTAAGESLLSQASRIEQATFNIERDVLGRDHQQSGNIRVTTAEDVALALLPEHLRAFQRAYPAISVQLLTGNRYYSLARGEADVAIRPGYSTNEGRVIPRKILQTYFGLFASKHYLETAGMPSAKSDLHRHPLIGWCGDLAEGGFASYIESIKTRITSYASNSLVAQRAMSEAGLGIALLPEFLGQASHHLVRVLPETRIDSGYFWILHHEDLRSSARITSFVDFMADALRQNLLLETDQPIDSS